MNKELITVQVAISAPVQKVWQHFVSPESVQKWNNASADWHTTKAENDLKVGGKYTYRMEARDGSVGFDFWGVYDNIIEFQEIVSTMGDGRKLKVNFSQTNGQTLVTETFEAESENSIEMQRDGWQSILNNFKSFVEKN